VHLVVKAEGQSKEEYPHDNKAMLRGGGGRDFARMMREKG